MKRIKFEKVKTNTFFILPAMGITKNHFYFDNLITYCLCFAWLKLHLSILIYQTKDNE